MAKTTPPKQRYIDRVSTIGGKIVPLKQSPIDELNLEQYQPPIRQQQPLVHLSPADIQRGYSGTLTYFGVPSTKLDSVDTGEATAIPYDNAKLVDIIRAKIAARKKR